MAEKEAQEIPSGIIGIYDGVRGTHNEHLERKAIKRARRKMSREEGRGI